MFINRRQPTSGLHNWRISFWFGLLVLVLAIFIVRLFYLQVIRHDYYRTQALSDQLKVFKLPAERGIIKAHLGDSLVPLVLNHKLYTLYGDPTVVENPVEVASQLAAITKQRPAELIKALQTKASRYQVLAKRLSNSQKAKIQALKLPGIGLVAVNYRVYPQGRLAAQILGFVNENGEGKYGLEE